MTTLILLAMLQVPPDSVVRIELPVRAPVVELTEGAHNVSAVILCDSACARWLAALSARQAVAAAEPEPEHWAWRVVDYGIKLGLGAAAVYYLREIARREERTEVDVDVTVPEPEPDHEHGHGRQGKGRGHHGG